MAGTIGRRPGVGGRLCYGVGRIRGRRITQRSGRRGFFLLRKFHHIRDAGERVVIDGPCLSACTLLTAMIPKDHICITSRAVLGLMPPLYDDASRTLVPTRAGSRLMMNLYRPEIRHWIERPMGG